jgi:hypothetical protein
MKKINPVREIEFQGQKLTVDFSDFLKVLTKICSKCKKEISTEEFNNNRSTTDGKHPYCKTCRKSDDKKHYEKNRQASRDRNKKWVKKNPEKHKESQLRGNLKGKYGISLEEYEKKLIVQNGVCAICNQPPNGRRLAVDHDHETDEVRGLLCDSCNFSLGLLKEDPIRIKNLLFYLERYGKR